ncbi:MAG: rubredoxin [Clostridia bacterium]|nr:rubredoxin [Clostridia bacterium]
MSKYVCTICGYVYDEALGDPDGGIAPGTKWEDVPEDWVCPVCGAEKSAFEAVESKEKNAASIKPKPETAQKHELSKMSFRAMSSLFSNLAKGSEKQYRMAEAEKFNELAQYFKSIASNKAHDGFETLGRMTAENIEKDFPSSNAIAKELSDRGAQRALLWAEKVTRIVASTISKYEKSGTEFLDDKNIFVCEICGFVYIGDEPPEICPVCKVPKFKIRKIERKVV